jgi:hypothetical protein
VSVVENILWRTGRYLTGTFDNSHSMAFKDTIRKDAIDPLNYRLQRFFFEIGNGFRRADHELDRENKSHSGDSCHALQFCRTTYCQSAGSHRHWPNRIPWKRISANCCRLTSSGTTSGKSQMTVEHTRLVGLFSLPVRFRTIQFTRSVVK